MKFVENIHVTRKRTKHGYYITFGKHWRKFFLRKRDAIATLRRVIQHTAKQTRIVTASDYAKHNSTPPAWKQQTKK